MHFDPTEHPHRRQNLLTGDWVLVSPHRTKRPWQGQVEKGTPHSRPAFDPGCYLCPGNVRANGQVNDQYTSTYWFPNDYSALLPGERPRAAPGRLLRAEPVTGECRVLCFSPRHDLSLAEMSVEAIGHVVDLWVAQAEDLGARYPWVQIFENKGPVMGCSNPHPHGQVWAGDFVPSIVQSEDAHQKAWRGGNLLLDCLEAELQDGSRIVEKNADWVLYVPFWATWPFELMLVPRRHIQRLEELQGNERSSLAEILKVGLVRYDNLFETNFPYSMGWHCAPNGVDGGHWQLHAHFFPPLLRSASVKKFMVGYEMLAEAQRDISPEQAAERLRAVSPVHGRSI